MYSTSFSSSHSVPKPLRTRKSDVPQGGALHDQQPAGIHRSGGAEYGVTWGGLPFHARRAMTVAAATLVVAGLAGPTAASAATTTAASSADQVSVIVREPDGAGNAPERAVAGVRRFRRASARHPGRLHRRGAVRPARRAARRRRASRRSPRTPGSPCRAPTSSRQAAQAGSLYTLANKVTGASAMWDAGYTGKGVDVAVIDSGVVPVDGLAGRRQGRLRPGPDPREQHRRPRTSTPTATARTCPASSPAATPRPRPCSGNTTDFVGMAPDARIVSIKVADAKGQTDVSQAIAAIDWVVQNRNKNGLNIRVLNMSFGTDGVQDYLLDPLAYAAEQAWHKGIVVVVAVGNEGFGTAQGQQPGLRPVPDRRRQRQRQRHGHHGRRRRLRRSRTTVTAPATPTSSLLASRWSASGAPGPTWTPTYPAARIGERLFRGSGTSQAAAVVSGAAALLIQQRPDHHPGPGQGAAHGYGRGHPGRHRRPAGRRPDRPGEGQGRRHPGEREADASRSRRVSVRWSSRVVRCTSPSTAVQVTR